MGRRLIFGESATGRLFGKGKTMATIYYTVCTREDATQPFGPEFGDYDKDVAKEEAQELVRRYGRLNVCTIKTNDSQVAIDTGVKELNEKEAAKA